jgi:hypothetical protein
VLLSSSHRVFEVRCSMMLYPAELRARAWARLPDLTGRSYRKKAPPKGYWALPEHARQWRGRSHGRGIPDFALSPIRRSTHARRQRTAPDEISELRIKSRASELDHRRLQASPRPLHDHPCRTLQRKSHGGDTSRLKYLTKDVRAICGIFIFLLNPAYRCAHAGYSLYPAELRARAWLDYQT